MKLNRKWMLLVALVLSVAMATTGTLAYLTDEDADVNTMTLGKVEIVQNEQERDEDGNLQPFTPNKPALPAVYKDIQWDEEGVVVGDTEYKVFADDMKNVVDKIVTVTNTGKTDAYIRTIIAIEEPAGMNENAIHVNMNDDDSTCTMGWEYAEINGVRYAIAAFTYNEKLLAGETSAPSLMQVFLDKAVDNEDVALLGDTWEILVLSQAVQADGFEEWGAEDALNEAFNDGEKLTATKAAEWFSALFNADGTVNDDMIGSPSDDGVNDKNDTNNPPSSADEWDGTADIALFANYEEDTEFVIMTAEQLAGFAKLVDEGKTFEGKTVKLGKNIDLNATNENGELISFNPIGHSSNGKSFNGVFDGQAYTISNLYMQSNLDSNNGGWLYEGEYYALFAYTNGAEIKNVTVANAYISSGRNEAAAVVGNAVDTTFADISVEGATLIAYNNSAGGVAAECYGDCSFTDITVDDKTVIGPLWGTYDVRLGGVVGMVKSSDKVSFSNVNVACQLDAINDVAANYQYWLYRYSGMLIGQVDGVNGVADPTGYVTCENVTVTYGDWMNYHYCEDADLGAGSYNGPGEYKYARVEAGTGTDGIDLSTCNHNEDESHNVLIAFDQLFGGGQGVKGLKTYDGVTVKYPAGYVPADN